MKSRSNFRLIFYISFFIIPLVAFSAYEFQPVTTHPDADFAGSVSPDGRWLAFTSKRSGNLDIWVKPVAGGKAFQITGHKADDLNPAWSPDGRKLAFTSFREDAAGDIWQVSVTEALGVVSPQGDPEKLTHFLGSDDFAKFSPDGKKLAFTSSRSGSENIWLLELKKNRLHQITFNGGTHPAWSPGGQWLAFTLFKTGSENASHICLQSMTRPDKISQPIQLTRSNSWDAFPCWSPRGNELVFSRIALDTNQDGLLTPADPVSLWRIDTAPVIQAYTDSASYLQTGHEIQLTPWREKQLLPFWGVPNTIYFSSETSQNKDIVKIRAEGLFDRQDSATAQLNVASEQYPFPAPGEKNEQFLKTIHATEKFGHFERDALFDRLLAFQRVIDYFPTDTLPCARALYEIGRTFEALNFPNTSADYFSRLLQDYPSAVEFCAFAEIERVQTRTSEFGADPQTEIALYENILQRYSTLPAPAARLEILIADILAQTNQSALALARYQNILTRYPEQNQACAEVQFKIGWLLKRITPGEAATQAYLKVVSGYPDAKKWVSLALSEIFAFEQKATPDDLIRLYRDLASEYAIIPAVAGMAQLKIAEILHRQQQNRAALEELAQILQNYSAESDLIARTKLLNARIFLGQGEDLKAMDTYESIIQDYAAESDGLYARQAKTEMLEKLLESGERLWQSSERYPQSEELKLALARFQKATQIDRNGIVGHRGVIKCLYSMRQIDRAIGIYQQAVARFPENEILRYSLGLCYSYKAERGEQRFDLDNLLKSNEIIEKALEQNFRLIQAYLTLSVNYELIERTETALRERPSPWYRKVANSITAPLATLTRFVFRIKEKPPEKWFERAIDMLTTAIALNDEKTDPQTEAQLALNLANNYYQLDEYGFELAYRYFLIKLELDPTFQSKSIEAIIYTRMGHCALVVEDFDRGPVWLKQAIRLYQEMGRTPQVVGNMKRLALLYQLAGEYEESIEYFNQAAQRQLARPDLEHKVKTADLATIYRQIAYNYNFLEDEEEIENYTTAALKNLDPDSIKKVKPKGNWLKIGIFGWEIPVYNAGKLVTGQSTAYEGFTTSEEFALLYSIQENSAERQQQYAKAIELNQKKLEIYHDLENLRAEAIILNNIAMLYYLGGNFKPCWDYFKASLKICQKEKFYIGALTNIFNLVTLTLELNRPDGNHFTLPTDPKDDFGSVDAAFNYVAQGLAYYSDADILLDPRNKMMLLNLKGNLHFLKAIQFYQPRSFLPITERPADWLNLLDELALADSTYRTGLSVALEYDYPLEIALLHLNRGLALSVAGEWTETIKAIQNARRLASQYGLPKLLWRVDHLLANLLQQVDFSDRMALTMNTSPEFYFAEALEIVQSNVLANQMGNIPAFQNRLIRGLYEDAIVYYTSLGEIETAFYLAESMRAQFFLSTFSGKRPTLKSEFDKNFWGHAFAYQNNIQQLQIDIRKIEFLYGKADTTRLLGLRRRLAENQTGYQNLLDEIKSRQPELEALVRVNPPAYQTIQRLLEPQTAVIEYTLTPSQMFIWLLTADDIYPVQVPVSRYLLRQLAAQIIDQCQRTPADDSLLAACRQLNDYLLAPVQEFLAGKTEIIFIPDDVLHPVPFDLLTSTFPQLGPKTTVSVAPALANFYYCYLNRKISGGNILFGAVSDSLIKAADGMGYLVSKLDAAKKMKPEFEQANILHLALTPDWHPTDPTLTEFRDTTATLFTGMNILSWNLKANLVICENSAAPPEAAPFTYFQHSLFYSGTPTLIFNLWPVPDSIRTVFCIYLYENLFDEKPATALNLARQALARKFPNPFYWAGFQLYGFPGMTPTEERQFANERFARRMLLGNFAYEEKSWDEAISYYADAAQMAQTRNDQEGVQKIYSLIVEVAFRGRLFDQAIDYQQRLLEMARANENVAQIAESYYNLMVFNTENRQFDQAVHFQQQYAELAHQYGQTEQEAESFLKLGQIYQNAGNFSAAQTAFGTALNLFRQIELPLREAECLLALGRVSLFNLRDYPAALSVQTQALQIFNAEGDDASAIIALREAGLSYEYQARYPEARSFQERALELASEQADTLNLGICQYNLANIAWKTGDYQQALAHLNPAIAIFNRFNYKKLNAVAQSTRGLVLMTLGQLDDALAAELSAKTLAESIQERSDLSAILKNMGLIYKQKKDWPQALAHFKAATEIDSTLQDIQGLADGYRNTGTIFAQQQQFGRAQRYLQTALNYAREIGDGRNQTYCLYELAQIELIHGRTDSAQALGQRALERARFLLLPELEWRVLRLNSQIGKKRGNLPEALESLRQAADLIEKMRAQLKVEDYKAGFIDNKIEVYNDLIDLLLETKQPEKAFEMVERAKSRNFVDLLANRDLNLTSRSDGALATRKDSLSRQISEIQERIKIFRSKSEMTVPDQQEVNRLELELAQRKTDFHQTEIQLQQANPELADLVSVNPKSVEEIRTLLEDSTGLVEFFMSRDRIYCWVVTRNNIIARSSVFSSDSLGQMVIAFRDQMTKRLAVDYLARDLYARLLKPVESEIKNLPQLVIVPHGFLHYVPFAALQNSNGEYLIDRHAISLIPSATVLAYCKEKGELWVNSSAEPIKILALGNPDLSNPALDLNFAEHEIRSLQRYYPNQVQSYLRGAATETNFRNHLAGVKMILFSCHGEYDVKNPLFSALLLAPDSSGNGRLEAHEIFGLKLNTDLIVMSACETGLGTLEGGDEVIGLSRSFIFAGTASLMSSLWKVDDLATAVLVKRFFRYLQEGDGPSLALKKAQQIVRQEIHPHPVYWAAFNITGDYR